MGEAPEAVDLRRPRRRFPGRRAGGRRNIRGPVHGPSADGNAQRDGLLAERQAVSVRLDAEHARTLDRVASWVGIDPSDVVLISEYTGGGFGSKGGGARSMAIPALLAKKTNAPVMMRISREDEHYIGRARTEHDRARKGRLPQGRAHPGARPVHRSGQRAVRAMGDHRAGRQRRRSSTSRKRCAGAPSTSSRTRRRARSSGRPAMQANAIVEPASRRRPSSSASIRSRSARSTRRPARRRSVRPARDGTRRDVRARSSRKRSTVAPSSSTGTRARRARGNAAGPRSAASASPWARTAPARSATTD